MIKCNIGYALGRSDCSDTGITKYTSNPELEFQRYIRPPTTVLNLSHTDKFVVNSLPRSGTIWMISMLRLLLGVTSEERIILSHVNDLIEDWHDKDVAGAVVLVRDMRDVVVSMHHHMQRGDEINGFSKPRYNNLDKFYFEYFLGLIEGRKRYCYGDLLQWINFASSRAIPILRYEDLLSDTQHSMEKVLNFWKIVIDQADLKNVISEMSFKNMQNVQRVESKMLRNYMQRAHLGKGQAGEWRSQLPKRVQIDIEKRFHGFQQRFNYTTDL